MSFKKFHLARSSQDHEKNVPNNILTATDFLHPDKMNLKILYRRNCSRSINKRTYLVLSYVEKDHIVLFCKLSQALKYNIFHGKTCQSPTFWTVQNQGKGSQSKNWKRSTNRERPSHSLLSPESSFEIEYISQKDMPISYFSNGSKSRQDSQSKNFKAGLSI